MEYNPWHRRRLPWECFPVNTWQAENTLEKVFLGKFVIPFPFRCSITAGGCGLWLQKRSTRLRQLGKPVREKHETNGGNRPNHFISALPSPSMLSTVHIHCAGRQLCPGRCSIHTGRTRSQGQPNFPALETDFAQLTSWLSWGWWGCRQRW